MPAFLITATVTCVFFFQTPSSAQTANPQPKTANAQSAATIQPARTGDSCWFDGPDGAESHPNCVLRDSQGKLFIAEEYVKQLHFDAHGLAQVFHDGDNPKHGWMYVDRRGRVVVAGVPAFDNWADDFSDGLVRTVINEKCGFADRHGNIVIAPKYDGASPFEHGYSVVCIGCRETCVEPTHKPAHWDAAHCEHFTMTGGEWFKINKRGRVVARLPAR
jgi:hypothetical protein